MHIFIAHKMTSKENSNISICKVKDMVQCNICLEVPEESPIYQCDNGHILCASCHEKLTDCPICRLTLRRTRSLVTEQLLEQCSRSCEFEKYGCKSKVHDLNWEAHKDACNYKPTSCMELHCNAVIPINAFVDHMRVSHEVQLSSNFTISCDAQLNIDSDYNNNDIQVRTTQFSIGGHQFFTSIWLAHPPADDAKSPSDQYRRRVNTLGDIQFRRAHSSGNHSGCLRKCWLIWLYMASTSSDSCRFVYTVKAKNKGDVEEYTYTGHPIPVETSREEVLESYKCLVLDKPITDRFTKNGNFDIQFDIREIGSLG